MKQKLNTKVLNFKKALAFLPEIVLLSGSAIYFLADWVAVSKVNYLAMACALIVLALIILKAKFIAITLSITIGLASIFMLLAVFSEYTEFPTGDTKGIQLLMTGSLLFIALLAISIVLPNKYFSK